MTEPKSYVVSVVSDLLKFVVSHNPLSFDAVYGGVVCFYCKRLQTPDNLLNGEINHKTGCLFIRAQEAHNSIQEDFEL